VESSFSGERVGRLQSLPGRLASNEETAVWQIICFGSIAAKAGALKSGIAYSSSKGAIHAMVKTLAKRGAQFGIYVNGIAPAFVQTPQTKDLGLAADAVLIGRLGYPETRPKPSCFSHLKHPTSLRG